MRKVIITGATSGIGRELAVQFSQQGYKVGATGRRTERLRELKSELGDTLFYRTQDVTDFETAEKTYQELAEEMGGLDIMILNAGISRIELFQPWQSDKQTIKVNALAFAHGMHFAFDYFRKQGHGHIVGMSSFASHLASGQAAAYTASKQFISNYMTGFRQKINRLDADITITDIRPGYVESELTEGNKHMFWVASTDKAVRQMITAIEKKKKRVYVTRRWAIASWVVRLIPPFVWDRLKL